MQSARKTRAEMMVSRPKPEMRKVKGEETLFPV